MCLRDWTAGALSTQPTHGFGELTLGPFLVPCGLVQAYFLDVVVSSALHSLRLILMLKTNMN